MSRRPPSEDANRTPTSVRLSRVGDQCWERLAEHHGLSKVALLEMILRDRIRQDIPDFVPELPFSSVILKGVKILTAAAIDASKRDAGSEVSSEAGSRVLALLDEAYKEVKGWEGKNDESEDATPNE